MRKAGEAPRCNRGAWALLLLVAACSGVSEAERRTILQWLTCEECTDGERAAVQAIGGRAVPLLAQVLEDTTADVNRELRRGFTDGLAASYRRIRSPGVTLPEYLDVHLSRYFQSVRLRAIQSLGDLGATRELQDALADSASRGFEPTVLLALHTALLAAVDLAGPVPDSILVQPESLQVEVGAGAQLLTLVLDSFGGVLPDRALSWSSSDSSVATVTAAGDVTGQAVGTASIVASDPASGARGQGRVFVVPTQARPVIRVVAGDRQSDTAYTLIAVRARIEVRTPGGAPASGLPVTWTLVQGGGWVGPASATTNAAGLAQAWWHAGVPGPQRLTVSAPGAVPVTFQAEAVPAGPTAIVGVVANDRDSDTLTLDPDEAAAGVTLRLYRTVVAPDSLLAVASTGARGAYAFPGLWAGAYQVVAGPSGTMRVLRGLDASGTPDATATVTTGLSAVNVGAMGTVQVGDTIPGSTGLTTLPRWDPDRSVADSVAPSHFSFLFRGTVIRASVVRAGGTGVSGLSVSIRRCRTSAGTVSPPGPGTCLSYLPQGGTATTDAAGEVVFSVEEGVYQVTPVPAGPYTSSAPASRLYLMVGRGDIEVGTFVVS